MTTTAPDEKKQKIKVKVDYVGHAPFHDDFNPNQTVGEVKVAAMHHFTLEASSVNKYVLKEGGHEQLDTIRLEKFDAKHISFELCLKDDVTKG